jgi:hypothetical protein
VALDKHKKQIKLFNITPIQDGHSVLAIAICIAYFRSRRPAGNEPPLIPPMNGIPFIGHLVGLLTKGFRYYSLVV